MGIIFIVSVLKTKLEMAYRSNTIEEIKVIFLKYLLFSIGFYYA